LDLVTLAQSAPGTEVVWAVRRDQIGLLFGGGEKDALEARGALGSRLRRLVANRQVEFLTGVRIGRAAPLEDRLVVEAEDGRRPARPDGGLRLRGNRVGAAARPGRRTGTGRGRLRLRNGAIRIPRPRHDTEPRRLDVLPLTRFPSGRNRRWTRSTRMSPPSFP